MLFEKHQRTKPLATGASASVSSGNKTKEFLQGLLDSIHELTVAMRIALKRNDAQISVSDALAPPENEAV